MLAAAVPLMQSFLQDSFHGSLVEESSYIFTRLKVEQKGFCGAKVLSAYTVWAAAFCGFKIWLLLGTIRLCSVSGHTNLDDIGARRLNAGRLRSLMPVLWIYNRSVGSFDGSDDPGRVLFGGTTSEHFFAPWASSSCRAAKRSFKWQRECDTLLFDLVLGLAMLGPMLFSFFSRFGCGDAYWINGAVNAGWTRDFRPCSPIHRKERCSGFWTCAFSWKYFQSNSTDDFRCNEFQHAYSDNAQCYWLVRNAWLQRNCRLAISKWNLVPRNDVDLDVWKMFEKVFSM